MQLLKIYFANNLHREKIKLNISTILPRLTGKEKNRCWGRCFHALILQLYPDGGFEQIKAAVLFAPQTDDALTLAGSAAHGGSRHEAKNVSTK